MYSLFKMSTNSSNCTERWLTSLLVRFLVSLASHAYIGSKCFLGVCVVNLRPSQINNTQPHNSHITHAHKTIMSSHPIGSTVDIIGISAKDQGRSCKCHCKCGEVSKLNVVVRFRWVQVVDRGKRRLRSQFIG
jgi:hypothetical protein